MSEAREAQAAAARSRRARLPPRWFIVLFWHGHRALLRATRGRLGLWRPKPGGWGTLRLTTTGRRTGRPRQVVVGYFEDGRNLITMAMNGWGAAEPAWWLNLQAHPDATAQTRDGTRRVRARQAQGGERERLWSRWAQIDENLDAYAARRPAETAVVILEPADTAGPAAGPGPAGHAAAPPEESAQLLAACLSAHQAMINGSAARAARLSRNVLDWLPPLAPVPRLPAGCPGRRPRSACRLFRYS